MPHCIGTPPFADDELLYRRLRSDWLDADGTVRIAGVGPQFAVDLPRCSVDRSLLAGGIEGVLSRAKPIETAVAVIAVRDVPAHFVLPASDTAYAGAVAYLPTDINAAHSEIWVRRSDEVDDSIEPTKKPGPAFKLKIRSEIAKRMVVVHPPRPPAAAPRIVY